MATIKQVNALLKSHGHDAELVHGHGYFYFAGVDASTLSETGLYGWSLKITPALEFVQEFERRKNHD